MTLLFVNLEIKKFKEEVEKIPVREYMKEIKL